MTVCTGGDMSVCDDFLHAQLRICLGVMTVHRCGCLGVMTVCTSGDMSVCDNCFTDGDMSVCDDCVFRWGYV